MELNDRYNNILNGIRKYKKINADMIASGDLTEDEQYDRLYKDIIRILGINSQVAKVSSADLSTLHSYGVNRKAGSILKNDLVIIGNKWVGDNDDIILFNFINKDTHPRTVELRAQIQSLEDAMRKWSNLTEILRKCEGDTSIYLQNCLNDYLPAELKI